MRTLTSRKDGGRPLAGEFIDRSNGWISTAANNARSARTAPPEHVHADSTMLCSREPFSIMRRRIQNGSLLKPSFAFHQHQPQRKGRHDSACTTHARHARTTSTGFPASWRDTTMHAAPCSSIDNTHTTMIMMLGSSKIFRRGTSKASCRGQVSAKVTRIHARRRSVACTCAVGGGWDTGHWDTIGATRWQLIGWKDG